MPIVYVFSSNDDDDNASATTKKKKTTFGIFSRRRCLDRLILQLALFLNDLRPSTPIEFEKTSCETTGFARYSIVYVNQHPDIHTFLLLLLLIIK